MSGSGGNAHGGYENAIQCLNNGAVKLYHAGVGPHLETNGGGIGSTITIAAGVGSTAITLDNSHKMTFG